MPFILLWWSISGCKRIPHPRHRRCPLRLRSRRTKSQLDAWRQQSTREITLSFSCPTADESFYIKRLWCAASDNHAETRRNWRVRRFFVTAQMVWVGGNSVWLYFPVVYLLCCVLKRTRVIEHSTHFFLSFIWDLQLSVQLVGIKQKNPSVFTQRRCWGKSPYCCWHLAPQPEAATIWHVITRVQVQWQQWINCGGTLRVRVLVGPQFDGHDWSEIG